MKYPSFKFELKSTPDKNGNYWVYIRTTQNKKMHRYKTSVSLKKESDWNSKAQEVRKSNPEYVVLNDRLEKEVRELKERYNKMLDECENVSVGMLKAETLSGNAGFSSVGYVEAYMQFLSNSGRYSEWKKFGDLKRKWVEFLRSKKMQDLDLSEITTATIISFEKYLRGLENCSQKGMKLHQNSIRLVLANLRRIMATAEKEKKIKPERNPFIGYDLPKLLHTEKEKLNDDELQRIWCLELEVDSWEWHCRNFFFFSFYCAGIRFEDVCMLRKGNIVRGDDGESRVVYTMAKNGKVRDLVLVKEAKDIIAYYKKKGCDSKDYLFPLLGDFSVPKVYSYDELRKLPIERKRVLLDKISSCNAYVNKTLKDLAQKAQIEKVVSFHIARHSFANKARNQGIEGTQIKGLLAHSSLSTTEAYMGEFATKENDETLQRIFAPDSPKGRLVKKVMQMDDEEVEKWLSWLEGQNGSPSYMW